MKDFRKKIINNQSGFSLVEVLISILILSIIISSASIVFVYSSRLTQENKLNMHAMNLANETVEYIRSLPFSEVGTKDTDTGIYGDPKGEIKQKDTKTVDGVEYTIKVFINWEEEGDWDALGNVDWDYKSVKVTVFPTVMEGKANLTKEIETLVTRDYAQPAIAGGSMRIRVIRGWNTVAGTKTAVPNIKVKLTGTSETRQILTTSYGAARFIDISAGNYTVSVLPEYLIALPGQETWSAIVSNYSSLTHEFQVEEPCALQISLKDFNGNPFNLVSGTNGKITVSAPYGPVIIKNILPEQVDANGKLPNNFLSGLWPVGIGYSGQYSISNVIIPGYLYLGSFLNNGASEELWDGTFTGPGTTKNITCYFRPFPAPGGINKSWVNGTTLITSPLSNYSKDDAGTIIAAIIRSSNITNTVTMAQNSTIHFNATSLFFENMGTTSVTSLYINNQSNLFLHSGTVVFRGGVEIKDSSNPSKIGKITLKTTYENGSFAPYVLGENIGGTTGVKYGKLYLTKPLTVGGSNIVEPGGYYYYDGLVLPNNASALIPITKENYVE